MEEFEVRIEFPGSSCNTYEFDSQRKGIRLAQVLHRDEDAPADVGFIPNGLTSLGHKQPVMLVRSQSVFPGASVTARPLGLVRIQGEEDGLLVAVPVCDEKLGCLRRLVDLGEDWVSKAETWLKTSRQLDGQNAIIWESLEKAGEVLHQARRRFRMQQTGQASFHFSCQWKVIDGLRPRGLTESEAYSRAEYQVPTLPYRFQKDISDLFLPEERILAYILRPPLKNSRWSILGRKRSLEGLFVITDRQVMMLTDACDPDFTLVDWGYIVETTPLERLVGVELRHQDPYPLLELTVGTTFGTAPLIFEFHPSHLEQWRLAAQLLSRFVPESSSTALRRIYEIVPDEDVLPDRPDLRTVIADRLSEGEEILVTAFASGGEKARPQWLTVTGKQVLIIPGQAINGLGTDKIEAYRISDLVSVTLCDSILGSWFKLSLSSGSKRREARVRFDSTAGEPFMRAFTLLRQLMANPF